ncbi:MAG TPA: hypothetical protein PK640_17970 [Verrucomicrobiota bacterium]|nr:hypothetical protein [Verrucomicrobiota bacterium]
MSFRQHTEQGHVVTLLQRSLERGRLGHAYLFSGSRLAELEAVAKTLAKTLNCQSPPRQAANGLPLDCCDACTACRKIGEDIHADVQWLRPESKTRLVSIEQVRDLVHTMHLKPAEGLYKVAVVVAADRMTPGAANAFLKTLEEPPAKSVLMLLTTEPQRVLETVISRCLRLSFAGDMGGPRQPEQVDWLRAFAGAAAARQQSLLGRYRLLGSLLAELARLKARISEQLAARSPLQRYEDVDPELRDRWETELAAATEAEYRRQRGELLACLQWWLRDVWMQAQRIAGRSLAYPELETESGAVAGRISTRDAMENLGVIERTQWLLGSNVQEALALEVGLLKLKL